MGDSKFRVTGRRTRQGPYRADEKARKRAEGEVRNEVWRTLSKEQQIRSLQARPGLSTKQITRIAKA